MNLKIMLFVVSILVLCVSIVGSNALPEKVPVNDPTNRAHRTLDEQFLDVSAKVPDFGGMFMDGDVLKVHLVNRAQRPAAESAIAAVFGRERIPAGGIQILQGQYSFTQLKKWHDRLGVLFDIQGVVFTDVDEKLNRLKVGVESPDLIGVVEKELIKQGIPPDSFVIEQTEPVVFAATLQDTIRPLQGGIQIRFSGYLCTMGFNGVLSEANGFVTNSHCTDKQGGVESTKYYQPLSPTIEYFIGTETADPLYTKEKCPPGTKGRVCRYSDSAYAQKASGVEASVGVIALPDSVNKGSLNIVGNFRIVSEGPSLVGETLNKVGRTTGWTQGTVTSTDVTVVRIIGGKNIALLSQDYVQAGVNSGDSGSPVFKIINSPVTNDVELRGILWGSSGNKFIYSTINNIQRVDELGPIDNCAPGFVC